MDDYLHAEISAESVRWNVNLLRQSLAPRTRLCAVVKADAYGHGLALLRPVLDELADCLAVATPAEALGLRELGYGRPLLMFSACAAADGRADGMLLDELLQQEITLTIVSQACAEALAAAARRVGRPARVHIKLDSGMGRSGVLPQGVVELVDLVRRQPLLQLTGIYTHLATADEADKTYALGQFERFRQAVAVQGPLPDTLLHAANSAATIDLPQMHLDMVRPGIALYGYQPSDRMQRRLPLKPVLRLTGPLLQIKTLPAGSSCGYGLTHTFAQATRVGIVPIGYADGYFRCLSNRACMRLRGHAAPVRGNISMDQTIIDLANVPQAQVGDEVEVISADPAAPNSVENLARLAGTIPYEITCRLGPRIRRILPAPGPVGFSPGDAGNVDGKWP